MKIDRNRLLTQAKRFGADLAGVARVQELVATGGLAKQPLEGAQSAVVVAVRQGYAALNSPVVQIPQHDTVYAYARVDAVAHALVRVLEDAGHAAVAVPAFLPIDMSDEVKGMVGEVDHRRAAVAAGIGTYGRNNLLLTKRFGPRVRLATVLTTAAIRTGRPLRKSLCIECATCVEACPPGALNEPRKTDKTACGKAVFEHGLRGLMRFGFQWSGSTLGEKEEMLKSRSFRELWQNFMVGMYYTCFACQAVCPVGTAEASRKGRLYAD